MSRPKISVIGTGNVGATAAMRLAQDEEIRNKHYYNYKNHKSIDADYLDKAFNINKKENKPNVASTNKQNYGTLSYRRITRNTNSRSTVSRFVVSIKYILPKRYREEYSTDIVQIYHELRNESHSKTYCYFFIGLNVVNVLWSALRFKYDEYFSKERSVSNKN